MEKSKTFLMAVIAILSLSVMSCNESVIVEANESSIPLEFSISMNSQSADSRGAADLNSLLPEKFIVIAYEKVADNSYKYCNVTSSNTNTYANEILSNSDFLLPVGVYRFLCLYNANGGNTTFTYEEGAENKSWDAILKAAKLTRNDGALDINEIFAFKSTADVNLIDMKGKFKVSMELTRVNSRIDVLVRKVYKEASGTLTEVGYFSSDVMGGASNISKVSTKANRCASAWNLSGESENSNREYNYEDTENSHILVGTKEEGSSVDLNDNSQTDPHKINTISVSDFKKGTCYYNGAYILPFETSSTSTMDVELSFHQEGTGKQRVVTVNEVTAKENYVSLITLNLITLKQPDPNNNNIGSAEDDKENIFNSNVQCEVTINPIWAGVDNKEVDI